jgi:DNA-binding transcriptional LysR family regulator
MTDFSTGLMPSYYADCAIFAKVAETLSYSEAGEALNISRSTVSKRIAALEQALGVILLNRSTRKASLTDAGQTLLDYWRTVEQAAHAGYQAVHGSDLTPSGSLRVSLPSSLAADLMPCLMKEFLREWPELRLNVHFSDSLVDVVGRGYDVVIRISEQLDDSVLTAKRLASSERVLAASAGYLATCGQPDTLLSLNAHRTLVRGRTAERRTVWHFERDDKPRDVMVHPGFVANNDLALVFAACLDLGILYIPKILIESELHQNRLLLIELEDAQGPAVGVYALYPHRIPPAKVRVFVDFVGKQLGTMGHLDRWRPLMR